MTEDLCAATAEVELLEELSGYLVNQFELKVPGDAVDRMLNWTRSRLLCAYRAQRRAQMEERKALVR